MTSYTLLPAPPNDIAHDSVLFCAGGLDNHTGEAALSPVRRPECLLVFAAFSGACEVRTPTGSIPVAAGGLVALPAGMGALLVRSTSPLDCAWALLGGALPLGWLQSGEVLPPIAHGPAEGMLRALWYTVRLGGAVDGYWGSAQAYGLLMKLRAQAAQIAQPMPRLVEDAAALIRADFAYLGGVEDLADRLGVSKSYLIRSFTAHIGVSPGKYLTQMRMEYAELLLQSARYSLETVADMVGISGANYFCKLFKAHTGLTPRAYAAVAPRTARPAGEPDQRYYL